MMDTPERIQALSPLIQIQAVDSNIMPQGNVTKITPEERGILGAWIQQGSPLD